jgi:hypothetical protein
MWIWIYRCWYSKTWSEGVWKFCFLYVPCLSITDAEKTILRTR